MCPSAMPYFSTRSLVAFPDTLICSGTALQHFPALHYMPQLFTKLHYGKIDRRKVAYGTGHYTTMHVTAQNWYLAYYCTMV